jgi:hypothetical protein
MSRSSVSGAVSITRRSADQGAAPTARLVREKYSVRPSVVDDDGVGVRLITEGLISEGIWTESSLI